MVAIRQKIINHGKDSIRILTLVPFACKSFNALELKGNPDAEKWNIMVQKRFKNDLPESVVPKGNISIKQLQALFFIILNRCCKGLKDWSNSRIKPNHFK